MSWTDPRFQARYTELYNTTIDLTAGTGVKYSWPVTRPKIVIVAFGIVAVAAFPNAATMTTPPVMDLHNQPLATGVDAIVNSLATLTPAFSMAINAVTEVLLDPNNSLAIPGPQAYPTALQGDLITFNQKTQGVGGVQSAKFYFLWKEVEATGYTTSGNQP